MRDKAKIPIAAEPPKYAAFGEPRKMPRRSNSDATQTKKRDNPLPANGEEMVARIILARLLYFFFLLFFAHGKKAFRRTGEDMLVLFQFCGRRQNRSRLHFADDLDAFVAVPDGNAFPTFFAHIRECGRILGGGRSADSRVLRPKFRRVPGVASVR